MCDTDPTAPMSLSGLSAYSDGDTVEMDTGLRIIKRETGTEKLLSGALFEVIGPDGATVGTYVTNEDGEINIPLDIVGNFTVIERQPAPDHKNARFRFEAVDGSYGPVEYTTRQDGTIDLSKLPATAFVVTELECPGYELDKEHKTVYVRPGSTIEIDWENTPITGQIQVYKYAAEANPVTGTPAGAPLQGAVYEISEARSGKVVDYITTDARGVAASKPLPLNRYKVREMTAPAFWQLDATVYDETLEYSGQIIKLSAYDKPVSLGVSITVLRRERLLINHAPHSTQFQSLTDRLLRACSADAVIPALSTQEIRLYSTLALLHDIGKRSIPPEILNKPAPLTKTEFEVMKSHTTQGCELLERVPELRQCDAFPLICDVCRHHHERWDGCGYPDRLSGGSITPWVQVVGLADAYNALVHPRVYKPAFSREQAEKMILTGACGAFAPRLLAYFARNISAISQAVYTSSC